MKSIVPTLVLVILLFSCGSAFAQSDYEHEYREWEVTGFSGPSFGSNFEFATPVFAAGQETSRTVGMHYDTGWLLGMRVNQNLGDWWSADLEYIFSNQPLRITNLAPTIPSFRIDQWTHRVSYNVSFLPKPRTSRFRPYLDAGAGLAGFYTVGQAKRNAESLGLHFDSSWTFLFNGGGGFKYLIMDQFSFQFDVKDQVSQVPSYGLPSSAKIVNGRFFPGIDRQGLMQTWQINMGFSFQWDDY